MDNGRHVDTSNWWHYVFVFLWCKKRVGSDEWKWAAGHSTYEYMMGGPERSRQVSQVGLMCCDIIQAAFQWSITLRYIEVMNIDLNPFSWVLQIYIMLLTKNPKDNQTIIAPPDSPGYQGTSTTVSFWLTTRLQSPHQPSPWRTLSPCVRAWSQSSKPSCSPSCPKHPGNRWEGRHQWPCRLSWSCQNRGGQ